jgi:hypothetical protein
MNPDGTQQVNLTNTSATEHDPAWSPDGTKIAFTFNPAPNRTDPNDRIYVMNVDGSGLHKLREPPSGCFICQDRFPRWSPDGAKIAFVYCCGDEGEEIHTVSSADGTNDSLVRVFPRSIFGFDWSPDGMRFAAAELEPAPTVCGGDGTDLIVFSGQHAQDLTCDAADHYDPSWSPDAAWIAFIRTDDCPCGLKKVRPDGTGSQFIAAGAGYDPAWSPDATKIANGGISIMNADGSGDVFVAAGSQPDWQPIPINAYPRPKGASPMRVSLVPAQKQCASPNTTHGAPLSFGSCGPPQLTSGQLTTGTPDANGRAVRMNAYLLLRTVVGNSSTPADEADVQISAHLNDVANKDLSDYAGALRASLPLRITDKDNTPSPGGPGAASTTPFQYGFDIPCTLDPAAGVGSDCSLSTTADTLVPGTIKESLRTVWQIGRVRVDDAGPDGNPDTTADNTVFVTQGVFVP